MLETLFIRRDSDPRDPPCDVAAAPFQHATHGDVYVGMVSGEHKPADCVEYTHVHSWEAVTWLSNNGYSRVETDP